MQYFASFEPFELFDEFNGVPGTYIKSFLISDISLTELPQELWIKILSGDSSTVVIKQFSFSVVEDVPKSVPDDVES